MPRFLFYLRSRVVLFDYLLPIRSLTRHIVGAVLAHADPVPVAANGYFKFTVRAFYLKARTAQPQYFAHLCAREFFLSYDGEGDIAAVRFLYFAYPFFAVAAELRARASERLLEFVLCQRQRRGVIGRELVARARDAL